MMKDIVVAVVGLALLGALWIGWQQFELWRGNAGESGGARCTMEAKQCPDGSYVGRTGPQCEFADCPSPVTQSGIRGEATLGPRCPVMRDPPDPACADAPYAGTLVAASTNGGDVIKEFVTNADGTFNVSVSPGDYEIRSPQNGSMLPRCMSQETIHVTAASYAETKVFCDTGIR
jgi:hypothetical protein